MTDLRYRSFGKHSGLCLLLLGIALLCCPAVSAAELESTDKEISAVVDHYIALRLKHEDVQPATLLNDENTIRRLSLDLQCLFGSHFCPEARFGDDVVSA